MSDINKDWNIYVIIILSIQFIILSYVLYVLHRNNNHKRNGFNPLKYKSYGIKDIIHN